MHSHINFGYAWQWTYGYLVLTGLALPLFLLSWTRKWPKVLSAVLGVVTLWSVVAFLAVRFGLDMNGRMQMPTESFLKSGTGRVLDIGAGTGRSTLMVLEARPHTSVVALDKFSDEYVQHFGNAGSAPVTDQGRERLLLNLKAAGVDQRASIEAADMRQLPFVPATFDAIVSAYTFEHVDRMGRRQALAEAFRVLKPGGEFLLMVLAKDAWLTVAWGPIAMHGRLPRKSDWEGSMHAAGFEIAEAGTRPATLYFLARKP
jgi:ubiquinone/menaquinone biosynthesis C-methylase UbiE